MLFSLKEKGQGMVEYALILVLVAIVVMFVLTMLEGVWPYIARFLARYWIHGVVIFLIFLLADLCARLIVDKLNNR